MAKDTSTKNMFEDAPVKVDAKKPAEKKDTVSIPRYVMVDAQDRKSVV